MRLECWAKPENGECGVFDDDLPKEDINRGVILTLDIKGKDSEDNHFPGTNGDIYAVVYSDIRKVIVGNVPKEKQDLTIKENRDLIKNYAEMALRGYAPENFKPKNIENRVAQNQIPVTNKYSANYGF